MPNRSLLLACGLLLGAIAMPTLSAEPAPKAGPQAETVVPVAPTAVPVSPVFVGVLKEGEKLPSPKAIYDAKKAAADKADLDAALHESMKIAIHIGQFALKLIIAIAIAAMIGLCIAVLVTWIRRRRQLMTKNIAERG